MEVVGCVIGAGAKVAYLFSAALVKGPTVPTVGIPLAFWKASTAACVREP